MDPIIFKYLFQWWWSHNSPGFKLQHFLQIMSTHLSIIGYVCLHMPEVQCQLVFLIQPLLTDNPLHYSYICHLDSKLALVCLFFTQTPRELIVICMRIKNTYQAFHSRLYFIFQYQSMLKPLLQFSNSSQVFDLSFISIFAKKVIDSCLRVHIQVV